MDSFKSLNKKLIVRAIIIPVCIGIITCALFYVSLPKIQNILPNTSSSQEVSENE